MNARRQTGRQTERERERDRETNIPSDAFGEVIVNYLTKKKRINEWFTE
jgi:hypothetical protein